ncbi:MAG: HlyD family type I secretion periplasmic adaptor subunit, partial [Desulfobulbaceae bacterium]|nr:HlyD family type I secretion periplasmic adaptor subunit [Desulfobulbaceae bacterium]
MSESKPVTATSEDHLSEQDAHESAEVVTENSSSEKEDSNGRELITLDSLEPEKVQAPPSGDYAYRLLGFLVLAICFGGMGGWAAFAPLESAVVTMGQVRDETNLKTVQHLEGGIVEEILVKDGDSVEKGQVLLRLNDTQVRTRLEEINWQYLTALAKMVRLEAERDGLDAVQFPEELQDRKLMSEVEKMVEGEKRLFTFRRESFESEIVILEQRIEQLEAQVRGTEEVQQVNKQRISAFADDIKEWQILFDKQLVDKQQLRRIRQQKLALDADVAGQEAEIARLRIQIGETRSHIVLRWREFMSDIALRLSEIHVARADYKIRMTALQEWVERSVIKAPASGIIVGMDLHTIGAVVAPGKNILNVVPQTKQFVIDIMISLTDIDKVTEGLDADIRFSAFSSRDVKVIEGRVTGVDADSTVEPHSGARYYKATVEVIEEGRITMEDAGIELISGMPAEVIIK